MAKEIKAIKCPNCGSVNKIELKPDFYKCTSCQTEYFLDDNDVNINYNHNFNNGNQFNDHSKTIKIVAIIIGCIIGFFALVSILIGIFSSSKKSTNNYATYSTAEKEEDQGYSASRYTNFSFLQSNNQQPVVMMLENRRYNSNVNELKNGTYISFYSPIKKKLVAEEKIDNESFSHSDFKVREFSDGNIYIVNNKTNFLRLDRDKLKTEDVGKKFFEANNELQIGVATIELVYEDNGDGLILLTKDGKKRYYYPLIQKLYTEKEYYKARNGFDNLLPNAKDKTIHVFTSQSSDYPEDKLQLIQLTYKDNAAGPKDVADRLTWGKDYGGSGIFTDRDPYRKVLVSRWEKENSRILNWKDLTPDRLYFDPSVLIDDGTNLLIQFRADANTKSAYKLQKLNRQNGTVEWTVSTNDGKEIKSLLKYKDGYSGVNDSNEIILLDDKGNLKSTYKLD